MLGRKTAGITALFRGFCDRAASEDGPNMGRENVKLFLRGPLQAKQSRMERETRARRRRDRGARGAYNTIREHAPQGPAADRDLYRAPGDPV